MMTSLIHLSYSKYNNLTFEISIAIFDLLFYDVIFLVVNLIIKDMRLQT